MDLIKNPQVTEPVAIHIFKLTLQFFDMHMVTGIPQNCINGCIDPALQFFVGISVIFGSILVKNYLMHFSRHPMTHRSLWRPMPNPNRPV
jgi:hypothetical protein